jgi:hypothetical protein
VGEDQAASQHAGQALTTLRSVAGLDSVQVIPMPYASPHLPSIAREGWLDGLEQMQLGKSELQKALDLAATPDAAYPPGLEITADSLGFLSDASIDYALAAADPRTDLAEEPLDGQGPVRVRDEGNNRLTLLLVNKELRASLNTSRDPGLFFAALASELAAGRVGPFVAAPAEDYGLAPLTLLARIGEVVTSTSWLRPVTLAEVLAAHPPPTRPIFLTRFSSNVEGFVAQTFTSELRRARVLLDDFLQATDSERAPIDRLRVLLYQAESRYWLVEGRDPRVTNLGLDYLSAAEKLIAEEFDKVDVASDRSIIIVGDEGDVPVTVVNRTGYPLTVSLSVQGRGLAVEGQQVREWELGPQENLVTLPVKVAGSSGEVEIRISSGSSLVDEETIRVRAASVRSLLPYVLIFLVVVAALTGLLVRRARS